MEEIKGLDKKIGLMKGEQSNKLDEHSDKLTKLKEQSTSFRSKVNDGFNTEKGAKRSYDKTYERFKE